LDRGELTSDSIASIGESLASKATPLTHNGYKVPIAQALVRRCLARITA
jgi:CO/xanthine dehydrogenase FAD-binding subunit